MGSIKQYTDIFRQNREAIDRNSAEVLNSRRQAALEALDDRELPDRRDEGFEKTSIDEMFAPDFGLNINRVNIPVDVASSFRCDVPNMSTAIAFVLNDSFHPSSALASKLPEGVIFDSLRKAAVEHPELVASHYGTLAPLARPGVALNTLLVQDGVFIYVPRGVNLAKPLQLVNIFSSPASLMAVRRVLIVMDDDSEAQLLVCDHTQDCDNNYLSSQIIEVVMGRGARFDLYDMEESSAKTARYSQLFARQEAGSSLLVNGITLIGGVTRNDYNIDVTGEHSETLLAGMAIGTGHQHTDNNSSVNHLAERCHSRQLFKYVLDEESTGAFEGGITVNPSARFIEAYQSNKNLLASTSARMHTKPQLLIYCDDVKCSHGATTGQLDAEALFYMRSRGISEKEARTMLMQAFMADVIDTVRMDGLRDRLRHLVDKRFHGQRSFCGSCAASCHESNNAKPSAHEPA